MAAICAPPTPLPPQESRSETTRRPGRRRAQAGANSVAARGSPRELLQRKTRQRGGLRGNARQRVA
eukprot:8177436-Lingulodinium_polyedra.AAC.1